MCCGQVRISTVYGGTWPASIWRAFMSAATANMRVKEFPTAPEIEYVTLRVDVTQGCLANPFTPPANIETVQYPRGEEPTMQVCTQPTSYQELVVPSVIGMEKEAAVSALHSAGFNVTIEYAQSSEPEDTVIDQDPRGGSRLVQTGTVTITVARGSPEPETVRVPNVVGMSQADATAVLERAGFGVRVVFEQACNPDDPECEYVQGAVWSQSPAGEAEPGSTVTIVVNP
jgi:hypothetical protein